MDLQTFLRQWDLDNGNPSLDENAKRQNGRLANQGKPFVIEFEAGVADSSTEWGLTNNAAGNICAKPYGSDYILAGAKDKAVQGKASRPGLLAVKSIINTAYSYANRLT